MKNLFNANLAEVDSMVAEAINNEVETAIGRFGVDCVGKFCVGSGFAGDGFGFYEQICRRLSEKRYYGGCEFADVVEQLAIDRAKEIFGAEHANVQPHSGAQANMAVFLASLEHDDRFWE